MVVERIEVRTVQGAGAGARVAIARVGRPTRAAARELCAELEDTLVNSTGHSAPIHVSRSHSGDWVAVGVAAGMAIGVDIERSRARRNRNAIARFIRLDHAAAESGPAFFAHWTLREAMAKCIGGSVLCRYAGEDGLLGATRNPGELVRAEDMTALCDRLGDDIYYALVLQGPAPGRLIRCS